MVSKSKQMIGRVDVTRQNLSDENFLILKKLEQERQEFVDAFNKKCVELANTIPITVYWNKKEQSPWGCSQDTDEEWYCDECPVQGLCSLPKNWSK